MGDILELAKAKKTALSLVKLSVTLLIGDILELANAKKTALSLVKLSVALLREDILELANAKKTTLSLVKDITFEDITLNIILLHYLQGKHNK